MLILVLVIGITLAAVSFTIETTLEALATEIFHFASTLEN